MPKILDYKALAARVLAVATLGSVGDWGVYIDAVDGKNHEKEAMRVAEEGDKAEEDIAKVLFPHLAEKYKYRR